MSALPTRSPRQPSAAIARPTVEPDYVLAGAGVGLVGAGLYCLVFPWVAALYFIAAATAFYKFYLSTTPISPKTKHRRDQEEFDAVASQMRGRAIQHVSEFTLGENDSLRATGNFIELIGLVRGDVGEIAFGSTLRHDAEIADMRATIKMQGFTDQQLRTILLTLHTNSLDGQVVVSPKLQSVFKTSVHEVRQTQPLTGSIAIEHNRRQYHFDAVHATDGYWYIDDRACAAPPSKSLTWAQAFWFFAAIFCIITLICALLYRNR